MSSPTRAETRRNIPEAVPGRRRRVTDEEGTSRVSRVCAERQMDENGILEPDLEDRMGGDRGIRGPGWSRPRNRN
jgi:hypothetical protein